MGQKRDDGFLRLLLDSLEPSMRWALDFRHESWSDPEIVERLDEHARRHDRLARRQGRVSLSPLPRPSLRRRRPWPRSRRRVGPLLSAGLDVYGYFRHEDEPTAPAYAERLVELIRRRAT